jgi:hypothetical protein
MERLCDRIHESLLPIAYCFANVNDQVSEPIKHEMFSCGIVETFKNNFFQFLRFLGIELCCVFHKHDLVKEMVLDSFI